MIGYFIDTSVHERELNLTVINIHMLQGGSQLDREMSLCLCLSVYKLNKKKAF